MVHMYYKFKNKTLSIINIKENYLLHIFLCIIHYIIQKENQLAQIISAIIYRAETTRKFCDIPYKIAT